MSKWIKGFPPNKSGNYLARYTYGDKKEPGNGGVPLRLDYDAELNIWYYNGRSWGNRKDITIEWWDEYGITESKIIKKLKIHL